MFFTDEDLAQHLSLLRTSPVFFILAGGFTGVASPASKGNVLLNHIDQL